MFIVVTAHQHYYTMFIIIACGPGSRFGVATVQVTNVTPYRHPLGEVSEMRCRVRSPIVKDEPRDTKFLWKRKVSDLLREGRCAKIFYVVVVKPISGKASNFHVLPDRLLDLSIKPFSQVTIVLWPLARPLWNFMEMTAA